ncbi:MAG TPA: protein kinase family protein [Candidatus Acidoferrales bacterium]|nr:protein kinase family protein [Candidatus Acidoferrales bacterium]
MSTPVPTPEPEPATAAAGTIRVPPAPGATSPEAPPEAATPPAAAAAAPEPLPKTFTAPSPGEVITSLLTGNTYTMGPQIGEGSFGVVFECADGWNNELAVKVLKPLKSFEEVQAAAVAEVQKLFLLRHPFVTYVYDAFEYRDAFYIVTERCHSSLAQFFTEPWFSGPVWLVPVARCLLQAVHFIHNSGFAHQDIHLANVFIARTRNEMDMDDPGAVQFKLGDLGVAKLLSDLTPQNTRAQWMLPPEVINPSEFGPIDHRSDLYHCGLLLLQLAYSHELRFTQQETTAGKPREMASNLPAPLNFALEKALRRHASMRTGTAQELWRDLNSPGPGPTALVAPPQAATQADPASPDTPKAIDQILGSALPEREKT